MSYNAPPLKDRLIIHPGNHQVTKDKLVMQTLLGSCVATCLYDERARVAGMNHFMLANKRYSKDGPIAVTDVGRYGINAMEVLINDLLKLGATKCHLKAKVFGGGKIISTVARDNFLCVGEINQRFVLEFLDMERIPVTARDMGGELGRVIHFHTDTFSVFRRYIAKTQTVQVEKTEHQYWSMEIQRHEEKTGTVILF